MVKQAIAFEAKYQKIDERTGEPIFITVPIEACAVHSMSRGEFYTQGAACEPLLNKLLMDGFVLQIGYESCVADEEVPRNIQPNGYDIFFAYNIRKTERDKWLNLPRVGQRHRRALRAQPPSPNCPGVPPMAYRMVAQT